MSRFPLRCLAGLATFLFGVVVSTASSAAEAPRMSAAELKAALGSAGLSVIDVRVDASAAETKIPGAAVEDPRNVAAWAAKYPKGNTLVLYCS